MLSLVDYALEQGAPIMLIQEQCLSLFVPLSYDALANRLLVHRNRELQGRLRYGRVVVAGLVPIRLVFRIAISREIRL